MSFNHVAGEGEDCFGETCCLQPIDTLDDDLRTEFRAWLERIDPRLKSHRRGSSFIDVLEWI